jgi:hypothetical protein
MTLFYSTYITPSNDYKIVKEVGAVQANSVLFKKNENSAIFIKTVSIHIHEYLSEIDAKFKTSLGCSSGAYGPLIHEKNHGSQSIVTVSLRWKRKISLNYKLIICMRIFHKLQKKFSISMNSLYKFQCMYSVQTL